MSWWQNIRRRLFKVRPPELVTGYLHWSAEVPQIDTPVVGLDRFVRHLDLVIELPDGGRVILVQGESGMGKTTLLAWWAETTRFEGPILYADLKRTRCKGQIEGIQTAFLRKLGVPPGTIEAVLPTHLGQLYRTVTGEQKVAVLLDNMDSWSEVEALRPGHGGVVIVTGRGAPAGPDHDLIVLRPLFPLDAKELLARLVDESRLVAEPEAVETLVRLCAGRPLALLIAGQMLAADATLTVGELVEELKRHGIAP